MRKSKKIARLDENIQKFVTALGRLMRYSADPPIPPSPPVERGAKGGFRRISMSCIAEENAILLF
ncbi:MAG: hypothetical protein D6680_02470 [Cyanobacteria bacterium J007]|nr:MAG: hypothetical protein D6680_02470 [Cyanobacteria bacterium J007]